ncbi:voltage-gated chloride channel family protein [Sphingobacterium corticibacter]|uniref:Chloride channel protein n=1 Tax=Sphingobacterium corticibacter TaxID=2171749 RepID=A0A2T8HH06_9SPHI|nr:voltage-gated chloride channel family protein [Sphingobacterium corticibacter]PVH24683.1 chloride channel protein [Sphingobacterium corticibacter]
MSFLKSFNILKQTIAFAKSFNNKYPSYFFLLKWLLLTLIIAVFIGTASALFLKSLFWATNFRENHVWLIGLLPIAGLLVGIVYYKLGQNVEAGNNLIIDTINEPKDIMPLKMGILVYLGTIVTHLFGGSAGREGTALQMAGSIADQFTKPFKLSPSDRSILIVAAVAGGFGSVFGTPLAGSLFAIEFYAIGKLKYNALLPAFLTAIFADLVAKYWNVPHAHYTIDFVPEISFINIGWAIVAGILFGICAATFSKSMYWITKLFKTKISYAPLRPLIGGIIVCLVVLLLGTTKYIGLGIDSIVSAFYVPSSLYDFAIKLILTVITLSAGFKGGEVTPLFFIGATLGSAISLFVPIPTGLLAGMGFVAVFAGATNTPLACILMAIELFGSEGALYVALACITAYFASGHSSIYNSQRIGEAKHPAFLGQRNKRMGELLKNIRK